MITRIDAPLRLAIHGRDGVGTSTVAAALAREGITVDVDSTGQAGVDIDLIVVAETLKPEDRAMIGHAPSLVVLNKADLAGFGAGGPIAVADRRAGRIGAMAGVPAVPMVALLATATLDDELIGALRMLTVEPADLTSTDRFLHTEHRVSGVVRARLLDTLDLFGIAHGVLALRQGVGDAALPGVLRKLSQIDRVLGQIAAVGAVVRYRRIRSAVVTLRSMAVCHADARSRDGHARSRDGHALAEFLTGDEAVIAVMAAAADVMRAAGLTVDVEDDPTAHLHRAMHWHRYARGPVNAIHRDCAADIRRGSLRLLRRTPSRVEAR